MIILYKARAANGQPPDCLSKSVDNFEGMLLVHGTAHINELIERNVLELLVSADIDRNKVVCSLVVADDNNIRILEVLELSDLVLHVVVGVIDLCPYAVLLEEVSDLLCVVVVLGADRNDAYLHRREPERECACEILGDDTDETLE